MQGLGYKEILDYLDGAVHVGRCHLQNQTGYKTFCKTSDYMVQARERDVTWINKKDYDYDEDKILEVMLESIKKDILEEQSCQNIEDMYLEMGIRRRGLQFRKHRLKETLKERFDAIDKVAEYNQLKVVHAMQKCKVNAGCFKYASGYGYDDPGRDTLEEVYAEMFSYRKLHWFDRRSHAELTHWHWHWLQICARAMSFYLQSENLMTHWKKSLESAHRMVLLRSTEFPIAR